MLLRAVDQSLHLVATDAAGIRAEQQRRSKLGRVTTVGATAEQ